ncbi:helix-turn-helix transcriptional regulator [Prevotella sp. kh1p2]|jgi:repressor LexA|uniref:S24 family peptidase n=1 Tax=Prevotella sp. kh1p2 TaxID=1761883 RepID=UPI0008B7FDFA|nr:S24 family peptidase [Prevotella sp. kh1p2]SES88468.1 Phage repressor protein C, contains Cro/C1-type HTH and peptisase s24 domains [Prevotella sp. kh1p2]SNU11652.1 Phage repressor protein C, contains Cro/C1-type HTH and peptisase s24 domains [Prevotellaceae bacterium KH2P17]
MILDRIKTYIDYKGITVAAFERSVGMSNASFGKSLRNKGAIGTDKLENILSVYDDLSPEWLLTGRGEMLKVAETAGHLAADGRPSGPVFPNNTPEAIRMPHSPSREEEIEALRLLGLDVKDIDPIPFVSTQVAAGFGSPDFAISKKDIKDYYIIPKWRRQHVDFIIEVTGDSMQPKYYPGEVIGCSILYESRFIQWNKPHVIATREQGLLIKRLMPSNKKNCLTAVSDNKDYPPFDIPQEEITGIAIVVGYVGLE